MRVAKSSSGMILLALAGVLSAQPPAGRPRWRTRWSQDAAVLRPPFSIPRGTGSHRSRKTGKNASIPRRKAMLAASRSARPAGARLAPGIPASANSCKAYGVGGILRMPGRLHITWEGNNLKIESDAGAQTRVLSFGTPSGQAGSLQGVSIASWDRLAPALSGFTLGGRGGSGGSLKVVTTQASPGYLARNGVPYGAKADLYRIL